jgi:phage terminase large subunit GpA-like protein
VLSRESSAEPGQWFTSRAEYQRGVMDAMTDPDVSVVVVEKAAQVGATELLLNDIGFHLDRDPAPILMIHPTVEAGETWSKERLAPMLRDTEVLRGKVAEPTSRSSENQIRFKLFPGGFIALVGANAPTGLAMRPIRIVLADEVDRFPVSAGTEGDPLKLAAKRQTTFWNRRTVLVSTPVHKATSVIHREYLNSDQRRFFVPCPACNHFQTLRWENVKWDKAADTEERDGSPHWPHKPESAHYVCEECGSLWDDVQRWNAVGQGQWRATAKPKTPGMAGFHIPGLLSPWLTLADIVTEFLNAKGVPELLQVWTNTVLGDVWEESGEAVEPSALASRGEAYTPQGLPSGVKLLAAGVDVQADRLECVVIGFGFLDLGLPSCLSFLRHCRVGSRGRTSP